MQQTVPDSQQRRHDSMLRDSCVQTGRPREANKVQRAYPAARTLHPVLETLVQMVYDDCKDVRYRGKEQTLELTNLLFS